MIEFDVSGFLGALGPKSEIAKWCNVNRTAPYGWERRRYLSSRVMAQLVEYSIRNKISLDMNAFFVKRREPAPLPPPAPKRKTRCKGNGRR